MMANETHFTVQVESDHISKLTTARPIAEAKKIAREWKQKPER
jgi:endonuclease YncB( thermonuclease family)